MKNGSFIDGVARRKEMWPSCCLTIIHHHQLDINPSLKSREYLRPLPIFFFLTTSLPSGVTFQNLSVESPGKIIQPFSNAWVSVFPQKPFLLGIFVFFPRADFHFHPGNRSQFFSTQNAPKVMEGKFQGNRKTTLRKGYGFSFLERDLS